MKALRTLLVVVAAAIVVGAAALAVPLLAGGFSARDQPWWLEAVVARRLRLLAMPRDAREAPNPVPESEALLRRARAHFGDHCALCHGADGSGDTTIGRNLFPKAPDMRKPETQSLSDGELFFVIHNGVRYTGMPAWGSGVPEDDRDSWELVHLIRRFPRMSSAEVEDIERAAPQAPHGHGSGGHGQSGSEHRPPQRGQPEHGGHSHGHPPDTAHHDGT